MAGEDGEGSGALHVRAFIVARAKGAPSRDAL